MSSQIGPRFHFKSLYIFKKNKENNFAKKHTIFFCIFCLPEGKIKDLLSCCRVETCCILLRLSLLDFSALSSPNAAISRSTFAIYKEIEKVLYFCIFDQKIKLTSSSSSFTCCILLSSEHPPLLLPFKLFFRLSA